MQQEMEFLRKQLSDSNEQKNKFEKEALKPKTINNNLRWFIV